MITKILLVASFVLLSWNSFELSKNNDAMRIKIEELVNNDQSIEDYLVVTKSLVDNNSKTLKENSEIILNNQESLRTIIETFKQSNAGEDTKAKVIAGIKTSVDIINTSVNKYSTTLADNKKSIELLNKSLEKQAKILADNKNKIIEVKKISYKVSDQIKKHAKDLVKHSDKLSSLNVCKNTSDNGYKKSKYKGKTNFKPSILNEVLSTEPTTFNKIAFELYKTKELQKDKKMKEALEHLTRLKTEVWKSRKIDNIPSEKVMSILSSIDFTKKKWDEKETDYKLNKVEEKINQLFFKPGFCK